MFEQFLGISKKGKPSEPSDTGPGPKSMISWTNKVGFYGEVLESELINTNQLSLYMDIHGSKINTNEPWLKFVKDNKILFVAKKPLFTSINFNTINKAGGVYGERILNAVGYDFKIRMLTGISDDYSGEATTGSDTPITHGSEWNELLYLVSKNNASYPKTSQVDDNLAEYTDVELGVGSGNEQWTQDRWPLNVNQVVTRGKNAITSIDVQDDTNASNKLGYRPCLELDFEGFYAPFFTYAGMNFIDTIPLDERVFAPINIETIGLYNPTTITYIDTIPLENRVFAPINIETTGLYNPSKVVLP